MNRLEEKITAIRQELRPRLKDSQALITKYIKLREQNGFTQKELGNISHFKQSAIARIENLKVTPRLDTFLRILEPLGYTIEIVPKKEKKNNDYED